MRREEEEEGEKEKGENERRVRGLIYRAGRTNSRCENRGGRKMDKRRYGCLDFRRVSKERDLLRFGFCEALIAGDVTVGYRDFRR